MLLLIEVSDTSLEYDREVKLPLYARAGILEVWIVDLTGEEIAAYSQPEDDAYAEIRRARRGDSSVLSAFPDLAVSVDDVLGWAVPG